MHYGCGSLLRREILFFTSQKRRNVSPVFHLPDGDNRGQNRTRARARALESVQARQILLEGDDSAFATTRILHNCDTGNPLVGAEWPVRSAFVIRTSEKANRPITRGAITFSLEFRARSSGDDSRSQIPSSRERQNYGTHAERHDYRPRECESRGKGEEEGTWNAVRACQIVARRHEIRVSDDKNTCRRSTWMLRISMRIQRLIGNRDGESAFRLISFRDWFRG